MAWILPFDCFGFASGICCLCLLFSFLFVCCGLYIADVCYSDVGDCVYACLCYVTRVAWVCCCDLRLLLGLFCF